MWKLYLVSEKAQYKLCKNGISPKKPYYKLVTVVLVLWQLCLRLASLAQAKNSKRSLRSLIAVQWSQSPTGIVVCIAGRTDPTSKCEVKKRQRKALILITELYSLAPITPGKG